MASGCRYVIIRTAWLYSEFGKNFCKTMLNLTATKPQWKCCVRPVRYSLTQSLSTWPTPSSIVIDKIKSADDKSKIHRHLSFL